MYSNLGKHKENINLDYFSFEREINNNPSAAIIDTRTKPEYDSGHIANSILIDFYSPDFLSKIDSLNRKNKYLIYCRSGNRSYIAVMKMKELGFEDVAHLTPGIIGWEGEIEY